MPLLLLIYVEHTGMTCWCDCMYAVDETRVTLKPEEGAEHDYVNANFIDVSQCYSE